MDCALWWYEQAQATYRYVSALHQGDRDVQQRTAGGLVAHTDVWGVYTRLPAAATLMKYHVGAIKRVADSAFVRHQRGIEIGIGEALANEKAQTRLYRESFARFPEKDWSEAFLLYITATASYILALAATDTADYRRQIAIVRETKNRLAWLWADIADANGLGKPP